MKLTRPALWARSERGFALLEVLVTSVVLGIALVGLALMYANGHAFVVGQGDERAALQVAQQKIEQQINAFRSNPFSLNPNDITQVLPMGAQTETVNAGYSGRSGQTSTFTRFTCIQWVNRDTFAHSADGDPQFDCPCTGIGTATTSLTKRICVRVTPANRQADVVVVKAILAGTP